MRHLLGFLALEIFLTMVVSCASFSQQTPYVTIEPVIQVASTPTTGNTSSSPLFTETPILFLPTATSESDVTASPTNTLEPTLTLMPVATTTQGSEVSSELSFVEGQVAFFWDPYPLPSEEMEPGDEAATSNLYLAIPGNTPENWQIQPVLADLYGVQKIIASPDRNNLAFLLLDDTDGNGQYSNSFDTPGLYVYNFTDSSLNNLTPNEHSYPLDISWWPDHESVTYSQGNLIFSATLDDISPYQLTTNLPDIVTKLVWSPDGQFLAINRGPGNLELFDPNTNEIISIADEVGSDLRIIWSPNSQWLAFSKFNGYGLYAVNSHTLEKIEIEEAILDPVYYLNQPAWSGNSTYLAYTQNFSRLFLWNADTKILREIVSAAYIGPPVWSPDGLSVAVGFAEEDRSGLLVINASDGDMLELSQQVQMETIRELNWSPDGQWIVFFAVRDGESGLYISNVNNGETYSLLDTTGTADPHHVIWLPGGKQ